MRNVPRSLILLLACGLTTHLSFAGGFQLNEHGARALAQACAFVARASDASAIYFNPAGISWLRGGHIQIGTTLIAPSYTFYGPTNYNSRQEWKMNDNVFTPFNVYATYSFTDGSLKGLGVGVGMTTPYGLGTEWPDDWVGKAITREIDLRTFYIMPTVSYAINDMISVGVGANLVISTVKLRRAVTNFDPELSLTLEGDGDLAYSWNAGVLVRPIESVSLGFTYRAQTNIDFTGTADFNPPTGLKALFPGGNVTTALKAPANWYAGVAWMPIENLELEFDLQGIQWSSYDKLEINFEKDDKNTPGVKQSDQVSPKKYKDTYIYRFGGEYRLPEWGLKLRAGYFYDANPVPDEHLEPLLPDADRHGLNIGCGYDLLPNLTVDFAYLHLFFKDRTTEKTSYPDGVYLDGLYRGSANLVALNFGYHF